MSNETPLLRLSLLGTSAKRRYERRRQMSRRPAPIFVFRMGTRRAFKSTALQVTAMASPDPRRSET
jgi:hypothetical protein